MRPASRASGRGHGNADAPSDPVRRHSHEERALATDGRRETLDALADPLTAAILESRLIGRLTPHYNRTGTTADRYCYVRLTTDEEWPRHRRQWRRLGRCRKTLLGRRRPVAERRIRFAARSRALERAHPAAG